jgi:hypothetical protein
VTSKNRGSTIPRHTFLDRKHDAINSENTKTKLDSHNYVTQSQNLAQSVRRAVTAKEALKTLNRSQSELECSEGLHNAGIKSTRTFEIYTFQRSKLKYFASYNLASK